MISSRIRIASIVIPVTVEVGPFAILHFVFYPGSRDLHIHASQDDLYQVGVPSTGQRPSTQVTYNDHLWPTPRYGVAMHPSRAFWEGKVILASGADHFAGDLTADAGMSGWHGA